MPDNQSNNRRPTPLEDEAHRAMTREFSEQMKQFEVAQADIADFEKNSPHLVRETVDETSRNQSPVSILADDGNQWMTGCELMDKVYLCQRPTTSGVEFAVVERLDAKSQVSHDVLANGSKPDEVLRDFASGQRDVLRLWTDDFSAQVKEQLALKYPSHDLSRVAEALNHRLTESRLPQQTLKSGQAQKHGGGIKI